MIFFKTFVQLKSLVQNLYTKSASITTLAIMNVKTGTCEVKLSSSSNLVRPPNYPLMT